MFRVKIAALYFLLTVFAVVVVRYAVDEGITSAEQEISARVGQSFEGFERMRQLQQLSMHNAAFQLSTSELAAYLRTLEDFRSDLLDLEREIYSRWPHGENGDDEARASIARTGYVREHADFIPRFAALLSDRLQAQGGPDTWKNEKRETFVRRTENELVECAAVAMNKCFYKLTYGPLARTLERERPRFGGTFQPDIVLVTDRRGVGWANSENAQWSDQEDFAERYPVVREIPTRGAVDDLVRLGSDGRYHFLTGMGMYDGDRYVGAILVGVEVDDELVSALGRTLGLDVTLVVNDKAIATSAERSETTAVVEFADRVLDALPTEDRYKRAEVEGEGDYAGIGFYYHRPDRRTIERERAAYVPRQIEDLKVVLSVDRARTLASLHHVQTLLPAFGAFLFGLGLLLFYVLIRQFTRPFETIDRGVQEVVNGNSDWNFQVNTTEELPRSLAQQLNRMVAVLTGRDAEQGGSDDQWVQELLVDDALHAPIPEVTEILDASGREPRELYQRRLYREFLDARDAVLGSGDPMPFESFVALLESHETEIRERYECSQVRFHVSVRDDQVVLAPEVVA